MPSGRGVSYCPPSCVGGVPGNEGGKGTLDGHAVCPCFFTRKGPKRAAQKRFLLTAVPRPSLSLYFSPPSYWVDNREEQQEESFPSLWYVWYNKCRVWGLQDCLVSKISHRCAPSFHNFNISRGKIKRTLLFLKASPWSRYYHNIHFIRRAL